MRAAIKLFSLPLAAVLVVLAAACGGSSGREAEPSASEDGRSSGPLVSGASQVLGASAERFQDDVQSLRAEMTFTVDMGEFSVDAEANMAFQAPDQAHMTMEMGALGSFEMLMLGTDIYMKMPGEGWVVMSLDDLGVEAETFEEIMSNGSFLDYQKIIEDLGADIQELGEEKEEGRTLVHYRATTDFADIMAAISDTFGAADALPVDSMSGPMTMDIWLDGDSLLPHRLELSGSFLLNEAQSMVFAAEMRFLDYNQPVEMPEPPEDAVPFQVMAGS